VWYCLCDPTFSRFSRTPTSDGQTDGRTDRQTQGHGLYRGCIASRGKNYTSTSKHAEKEKMFRKYPSRSYDKSSCRGRSRAKMSWRVGTDLLMNESVVIVMYACEKLSHHTCIVDSTYHTTTKYRLMIATRDAIRSFPTSQEQP